jgi:hypothetical protein
MRASIFGIRVDEVMKYSVQSTKLCLGKSDLIIVFSFSIMPSHQDRIVYLLRTRNILIVPQFFYPKIDDSFDIGEKA